MSSILSRILGAIFPENCNCIFCGKEALLNEQGVCENCAAVIKRSPALPAVSPLAALSAAFRYDECSSLPVKRLKYGKQRWVAHPLSRFLGIPDEWEIDLILPVPLHSTREKERGFNQSFLLAQGLAERCGIPLQEGLLLRYAKTKNQAELDRKERLTNVKGAFACNDPAEVAGKNILLIDDVITTGSTMAEGARTLIRAGASRVYGLAVCYQADSPDMGSPLYFR